MNFYLNKNTGVIFDCDGHVEERVIAHPEDYELCDAPEVPEVEQAGIITPISATLTIDDDKVSVIQATIVADAPAKTNIKKDK